MALTAALFNHKVMVIAFRLTPLRFTPAKMAMYRLVKTCLLALQCCQFGLVVEAGEQWKSPFCIIRTGLID